MDLPSKLCHSWSCVSSETSALFLSAFCFVNYFHIFFISVNSYPGYAINYTFISVSCVMATMFFIGNARCFITNGRYIWRSIFRVRRLHHLAFIVSGVTVRTLWDIFFKNWRGELHKWHEWEGIYSGWDKITFKNFRVNFYAKFLLKVTRNIICRFYLLCKRTMEPTVLVELFGVVMIFCCEMIIALLNPYSQTDLTFFSTITQIFFYCGCAELVATKASEVSTKLYGSYWYNIEDEQLKKLLIIVLKRSQQSCYFSFGDYSPLSMETFARVCRCLTFCFFSSNIINFFVNRSAVLHSEVLTAFEHYFKAIIRGILIRFQ